MQDFIDFRLDNETNNIILLISTEDLYYLQDGIYDYLSKTKGESFTVVVDLFLRNGFSFNRFVLLQYNAKDKCKTFIINPREISDEGKASIRNYLRCHEELLKNSSLSKKAINFILSN